MYSESDIDAAVASGALTREAAVQLRQFAARSRSTPTVDEEHFRLITGFNDIFVSIAAVLLLFALAFIGGNIVPASPRPSPISGLLVATAAWGLAEFFTRRRRMALPSIILLLAFVGGVFEAVSALVGPYGEDPSGTRIAVTATVGATVAAAAAWLHWRRFQVPITIAAGVAALVAAAIGLLLAALPQAAAWLRPVMFASGIAVFVFAMHWDIRIRLGRRAGLTSPSGCTCSPRRCWSIRSSPSSACSAAAAALPRRSSRSCCMWPSASSLWPSIGAR